MATDLDEPQNPHREPCQSCGEETAEGSPFFFDRHRVEDPSGHFFYICSSCVARSRKKRRSKAETNPAETIAANGLAVGLNSIR